MYVANTTRHWRYLDAFSNASRRMSCRIFVAGLSCRVLSLHAESIAYFEKTVDLSDGLPVYVGVLGQTLAHAGQRDRATELLRELGERSRQEYVPPVSQSLIAMAVGESDKALDWLEQEYQEQGVFLWCLAEWPFFDDFRADPRFQALLKKMNFPVQG